MTIRDAATTTRGALAMTGMAKIRAEHDPQQDVPGDFDEDTLDYLESIMPFGVFDDDWEGDGA